MELFNSKLQSSLKNSVEITTHFTTMMKKHTWTPWKLTFFKFNQYPSTNGKLVVWGPVVWDSNRGTPIRIPIPDSFSGIQSESKPPGPQTIGWTQASERALPSMPPSPNAHSPTRQPIWSSSPLDPVTMFQWLFLVPLKGGIGSIFHPPIGRKNTTYIPLPKDPCMVYLPTFTIKINQMQVNKPYMDPMGLVVLAFVWGLYNPNSTLYRNPKNPLWPCFFQIWWVNITRCPVFVAMKSGKQNKELVPNWCWRKKHWN